jgi:hypothetical protein
MNGTKLFNPTVSRFKHFSQLICSFLFLINFELKCQPATISINPPSCGVCCNGAFTVDWSGTCYGVATCVPTLNISQSVIYKFVSYSNVCPGAYTVSLLPGEQCNPINPIIVNVIGVTDLPEYASIKKFDLNVHPNPAGEFIQIQSQSSLNIEQIVSYGIYNSIGVCVRSASFQIGSGHSRTISTTDLASGIYYFRFKTMVGFYLSKSFVVQRN